MVIVGKALYENKFTIRAANNILSPERINDIPINKTITPKTLLNIKSTGFYRIY